MPCAVDPRGVRIPNRLFLPQWLRGSAASVLGLSHFFCPAIDLPCAADDDSPFREQRFQLWGLSLGLTADLAGELGFDSAGAWSFPPAQLEGAVGNSVLNAYWGYEEITSYPKFGLSLSRAGCAVSLGVALMLTIWYVISLLTAV